MEQWLTAKDADADDCLVDIGRHKAASHHGSCLSGLQYPLYRVIRIADHLYSTIVEIYKEHILTSKVNKATRIC